MAFKHKVSTHIEFMFTRSMFQTEDLQKQHEILNEVARLIDLGMINHFSRKLWNHQRLHKAHAF
jgi:hypothetical protein